MHTSDYIYHNDGKEFHGFLAYDDGFEGSRPGVLIAHDWSGRNEFACQKAQMLAKLGYVGFALDMYGQGRIGTTVEEKKALMEPLIKDRELLRKRITAGLDALTNNPIVNKKSIAVIGFCFGGLCALDLARSGTDIKGAISFHGLLNKPEPIKKQKIKAKILVMHGYNDPMVQPKDVNDFCQEMTQKEVDWQVHVYGNVRHGFTNPQANDTGLGIIYNEIAAKRSWSAMTCFLHEIFNDL